LPEQVSKKYGIDTARLFLVSIASPDKDTQWSESGIEGTLRFVNKVIGYYKTVKQGKSSEKTISKYNKTVKEVSDDIENFSYNMAIIKLRDFFDSLSEEEDKEILQGFLKLLHPFCPHITEELWHKLGNKSFISIGSWPKYDEKKINKKFEEQDKAMEQLKGDINHILKIVNKKPKKIYVYVIPKELELYNSKQLKQEFSCKIEIVANNKASYDPQKKAQKAKPAKPALYIE